MKDILKQVTAGIILLAIPSILTYFLGWWPFIIKGSKSFIMWFSQTILKRKKVVAKYSCFEEVFVLFTFTKVDGRSLSLEDIANAIKRSNIRTLHALDKLQEKGLVVKLSLGGGDCYGLTPKGREEVVKLNIDEALKNSEGK